MKIFTAVDITLMGHMHPEYGQSYWGTVQEQSHPVRFNLSKQVDIMPGQQFVAAEYEERRSKGSNNPYTQLKKVKLSETEQLPEEFEEPFEEEESLADVPTPGYAKARAVRETLSTPLPEKPSYEAGTNARWALKLSVDTYRSVIGGMPEKDQDWTTIEDFARWLIGAYGRLYAYKPEEEEEDGGD